MTPKPPDPIVEIVIEILFEYLTEKGYCALSPADQAKLDAINLRLANRYGLDGPESKTA